MTLRLAFQTGQWLVTPEVSSSAASKGKPPDQTLQDTDTTPHNHRDPLLVTATDTYIGTSGHRVTSKYTGTQSRKEASAHSDTYTTPWACSPIPKGQT